MLLTPSPRRSTTGRHVAAVERESVEEHDGHAGTLLLVGEG